MRPVARALIAACLAALGLVLTAPMVRASAGEIQQPSGTKPASSRTLTISIGAISPRYARFTSTVTLRGTLSNHTGSAIAGIEVQAETSNAHFDNRTEMDAFASDGKFPYFMGLAGAPDTLTAPLANGATVHWKVSFPAELYYSQFDVYPIQVVASSPSTRYRATAQTFLPYWAGKSSAAPLRAAWVWPLIGMPQSGACSHTLATSRIANSLDTGGRLSVLLQAGLQWTSRDQLTWAIDPALLSDATVLSHPYFTGGNSTCTDRTRHDASAAAASWLSALRSGTAGQSAFLTPYANVDVAALSHNGLDADIRSAYQLGEQVAGQILPGTFGKAGHGTGNPAVLAAAWPANGIADTEVLTSLARDGGVKTVLLNNREMASSSAPYDGAIAGRTSGAKTSMSVLLTDSELTGLLGTATTNPSAGARFTLSQEFLAQTAMIVAELPNKGRTLVIAPPAGWHPSATEASTLLMLTHELPWLRVTGLGTLAADAGKVRAKALPLKKAGRAELTDEYLDQVAAVGSNLAVFKNLLYRAPADYLAKLGEALAATESASWRGTGAPGGWLAVTELGDYLNDAEHEVQIISGRKILLAGTSGTALVSVRNGFDRPVQVRMQATTPPGSKVRAGPFDLLVVQPGKTNTVSMPVHSSTIGTTTMRLQLVTRNGSALTWTAQPLSVEVTRFGRALLLVIGGALVVLVLTAAFRLRRRRLADGKRRDGHAEGNGEAGGTG